jgi:GTP cyclohydrolase I
MIDIQSDVVQSRFAIESVGVTGLSYPLAARDGARGEVQRTAAQWRMGVSLPAERRGTHMSRFVAELHARSGKPMDLDEHYRFAQALCERLNAPRTDVTTAFTWFREVKAPVTGLAAFLEGRVEWRSVSDGTPAGGCKSLTVQVPAKSLCPCSKAISERGAHNQRSDISVTIEYAPDAPVLAINRLMELVEQSASSPVYPLLKREDEKHITEAAYDNAVFSEDLVRNVAQRLYDLPDVKRFVVEAINRESIHAHDCYARIVFSR